MKRPIRVLLHNGETTPLVERLSRAVPDAEAACCNTYADLPAMIAEFKPDVVYTVRFAGSTGFPVAALFGEDGPKWVSNGGAGTDHFGRWDKSKTTVTNGAGAAADMMAEYVIGAFLHFTLDVPGLQEDKRARVWNARTVRPLKGQTLLIIGLGHTGRAIAARAKAFGMSVIGTRNHPCDMQHVDEVLHARDLHQLVPRADCVAICTPLTQQTRGLLDEGAFARMKRGVLLADVSRGGVVDQSALAAALGDGIVGAAALDVFETEPLPPNSPFWTLDNVIVSPHCSSVHDGWEMASFDLFLDNLQRWIAGRTLRNVVDPDRGY